MGLALRENYLARLFLAYGWSVGKATQNLGPGWSRPIVSTWEDRRPAGFVRAFADLLNGSIETELPYEVVERIERRDARRGEVETFCVRLAFAELHACLRNEQGAQIKELARRKSKVGDLRLIETQSALLGGRDLTKVLARKGDRNIANWRADLINKYSTAVSKELGVKVNLA